ncbi:MAG: zinc ABC transporter substrate-binding protein [Rubricoccaceae bacterium]
MRFSPARSFSSANRGVRTRSIASLRDSVGKAPWVFGLAILVTSSWLAGCAAPEDRGPIAERPVQVVATTNIVADLARQIGGDRVEVTALMGPGVDPHLYRASEGDVGRMTSADIIVYNGLELEGKIGEVLEQVEGRGIRTVAVAEGISEDSLAASAIYENAYDPHVWMAVPLWKTAASELAEALTELDPTHAEAYQSRLSETLAAYDSLDSYVRQRVGELAPEQRVLVTAHDAFGYFGRSYGFEVRGLQGISTATEAGTRDVQDLVAFVVEREIPAMFVESSVSPGAIEAVREAVQAGGHEVEIGGNLFSDALGQQGTPEGTYEGMIRHNVDTVVDALTGEGRGGGRDGEES